MTPPVLPSFQSPRTVLWNGKRVTVRAMAIPRFFWMTSSIDVYLDNECILRTGGQLNLTGSVTATFNDSGSPHQAELHWGNSQWYRFPYQLRIDGVQVDASLVPVENKWIPMTIAGVIGVCMGTCAGVGMVLIVLPYIHRLLSQISSVTQ